MAPRMAQHNAHDVSAFHGLKLDTQAPERGHRHSSTYSEQKRSQRPDLHPSADSQDTVIRVSATPPIEIPGQHDEETITEEVLSPQSNDEAVEQYLRERKSSITFNNEVKTDTGHRHSILEPPGKSRNDGSRGRSMAQAMSQSRFARPHSESDRSHFDPFTGRHLPGYSQSPPKEEAKIGEARFPLLQETVNVLAQREPRNLPQPMSLTSDSTMSPVEEAVVTPPDSVASPISFSPSIMRQFSTSYESSPRPRSRRKASERWRDGETAPDFFSKAGSLKRGDRDSTRFGSRRDTASSTKSPRSAASSFLRKFSMSSGTGTGEDIPPPVDAEGATVGEDYVLGKQIGYGGFSIIREVTQIAPQTGTQRTLAVKIVRKQIEGKSKAENDTAQAEFEHEVDLWRLLNHKHILSLEAVYELKEATFCFVPLNTGGTLFDLISKNRQGLAPALAANYAYQLASALRYLHLDARVVHRDIKLENCLVDTTNGSVGHLRVCDFGLAEWISSDTDSTTSSQSDSDRDRPLRRYFGPADSSTSAFAGGSLEYAAPEILRIASNTSGDVHAGDIPPEKSIVSPAVDIWAYGVCLFALLMGRRPFQDAFQPRVVMAILAGDWNKRGLKEKTGESAYKLVRTCLNMDAARRPSIGDIAENSWFDEIRSAADGSDAESESARSTGWRL